MAKVGPRGSYGIGGDYIKSIRMAGGCPVILSATNDPELIAQYIDSIDGFLCPGGGDIAPHLYGEDPVRGMSHFNMDQDVFEIQMIKGCVAAKKPVFGICRGMQLMNVALGGTLIQDLPAPVLPFHVNNAQDQIHPIRAQEGSLLHQLYGPVFSVNSRHHQVVDQLGEGLLAIAWAEAGFPEGLVHTSLPLLGIQFHPERLSFAHRRPDAVDGAPLFHHFLDLCRS